MKTTKIISLILLAQTLIFLSCYKDTDIDIDFDLNSDFCTSGEGIITTQILSVSNFASIHSNISANITVSQGSTQVVTVTGHPNIFEKIRTQVFHNTWQIELDNGCYENIQLDIEGFSSGIYMVNIITPNGQKTVKFIKK